MWAMMVLMVIVVVRVVVMTQSFRKKGDERRDEVGQDGTIRDI